MCKSLVSMTIFILHSKFVSTWYEFKPVSTIKEKLNSLWHLINAKCQVKFQPTDDGTNIHCTIYLPLHGQNATVIHLVVECLWIIYFSFLCGFFRGEDMCCCLLTKLFFQSFKYTLRILMPLRTFVVEHYDV